MVQDMDALVCRRTLTGHRDDVLCITGIDALDQGLVAAGEAHGSQEEGSEVAAGVANGSQGVASGFQNEVWFPSLLSTPPGALLVWSVS